MKTIITLINLVKSELFITLDHAERCLEMFISERQSNASLQQFTQALQQIRGSLAVIEIKGAVLLTDLMLEKAIAILNNNTQENLDETLSILSTSIFKLRRYLESLETFPDLLSELLIPAINDLRATEKLAPLPISYFADIKLSYPPLAVPVSKAVDNEAFGRLRQMYQIGLLGLIKEENKEASLRMMSRAIERLQKIMNQEQGIRLCVIVSAALESFTDSKMTAYPFRKKLFRYVDQQLRDIQIDRKPCNESLLKDLLYIVLLDNVLGIKALTVFSDYNLSPLPYNNSVLESEMVKLVGPGHDAICSFTAAIREELAQTQTVINDFTSEGDHKHLIEPLLINLKKLLKTLSLVNLQNAEIMLKEQVGILEINKGKEHLSLAILDNLADVVLHVESIVLQYESSACCDSLTQSTSKEATLSSTNLYFKQGRELATKEVLSSISTAQLNITAYVESKGDKQFLENMPQILDEVYGCLLFLNQPRAAKIVRQCSLYISQDMLTQGIVPETKQLDNLADLLASLEFFIETGMRQTTNTDTEVLELAEKSLATLNAPRFELPVETANLGYSSQHAMTASTNQTIQAPTLEENLFIDEEPLTITTEASSVTLDETPLMEIDHSLLFEEEHVPVNVETPLFLEEEGLLDTEQPSSLTPTDSNTLKFNTSKLSSFSISTSDEHSLPETEAVKEEPKETLTVKPKMAFSLEPINEEQSEEKEENQKTIKSVTKKNDDDDITFTRPENWSLS